jgi:hypothetical protein
VTQWGLDTLFNPAKRHMDEEKRRLQFTREEVGDASGGKRIDFESGKVRIHKPEDDENETDQNGADAIEVEATEADATVAQPNEAQQGSESKPGARSGSKPEGRKRLRGDRDEDGKPSAAAVRAAERRGRTVS